MREVKALFRRGLFWTAALYFWFCLPQPLFQDPASLVLTDRSDRFLSATLAEDQQWRFVASDHVSDKFKAAIRIFEDQGFYAHPGVDLKAIARAIRQNVQAGEVVSGASTLTMQVVRLARKNKKRTFVEKLIEVCWALRLELTYSKDEIMALYAAHAPFGGNVVGLEAASWRYFGRDPSLLGWGEIAALAVLPNEPAMVRPGKNEKRFEEKRNGLLKKLWEKGVVDQPTYELALLEPLPGKPLPLPNHAWHLLSKCKAEGIQGKVQTALDLDLQKRIQQQVNRYGKQYAEHDVHNMAVLVIAHENKSVLAYVGNVQDDKNLHENWVDLIQAPRSTGSILKPFLYASALDEGEILPEELLLDVPTQIADYKPLNFAKTYDGLVPASHALTRSLNIPAVRLLRRFGLQKFYNKLQRLGFSHINKGSDHYGLSVILGGAETTLWEACSAYAGMALTVEEFRERSSRYDADDFASPAIRFNQNREETELKKQGVINAGALWVVLNQLTEVTRPDQEEHWMRFEAHAPISWKTGTSFGQRDAWAIGSTPGHTIGVWCGNANGKGRPGLTGLAYAAPVLFEVLKLLPGSKPFEQPYDDLIQQEVCKTSGLLPAPSCPLDTVWTSPRGQLGMRCNYHQRIHLNAEETQRVTSKCYPVAEMKEVDWFSVPPYVEHYYKQKNPQYMSLPPWKEGCQGESREGGMALLYPKFTKQLFIPKNLGGEQEKVVFEAFHRQDDARIFWHLNTTFVGETQGAHQLTLGLKQGSYTLTLVDMEGEEVSYAFDVVSR